MWLVHRLSLELGASRVWALAAAALLLVDRRSIESLAWIVERQTTLACCCGLMACLAIIDARHRRLSYREMCTVAALLLAAGLSKEYGLAFAAGIACGGTLNRRTDLVWTGALAVFAYGMLRLTLADGAIGLYCEDMGHFSEKRDLLHCSCIRSDRPPNDL